MPAPFGYDSNGMRYPVISLVEAIEKLGFSIDRLKCPSYFNRERAAQVRVLDKPRTAALNAGGDPWHLCGGAALFSFGFYGEPDSHGYCLARSASALIVAASREKFPHIVFELVFPC